MNKIYTPVCPQCKCQGNAVFFPYSAVLYECKNKHGWFYNSGNESVVKQEELEKIKKFFNH